MDLLSWKRVKSNENVRYSKSTMFTIIAQDEKGVSTDVEYLQLYSPTPSKIHREGGGGAMRAWLRWWCCCECVRGRGRGRRGGGDAKGLLPSAASADDLPRKETCYYSYNVRRISSFGRAESKEALQWSGDESGVGGEEKEAVSGDPRGGGGGGARPPPSPVPSWSVTRSSRSPSPSDGALREADVGDGGGVGAKRPPWFKRIKKAGRPPPLHLHRELASSTPDLARLPSPPSAECPRSSHTLRAPLRALGASSGCLSRAGAAGDAPAPAPAPATSSSGVASYQGSVVRWTRSQSMESIDLSTSPSTPLADDVFREEENPKTLAQTHGLNMSLYSLNPSISRNSAISKSTSKLSLWPPSKSEQKSEIKDESTVDVKTNTSSNAPAISGLEQPTNTEDFVDQPCGSIIFTASYIQKNKKLCIQLNKLENLPPKGKNTVYDVVVRLSVLPADKQVKTSQILRGSLSPMAQEDFSFSVKEPIGKVLRFSVFNALLQGKHDVIGHALFNIEDVMSGRSRKYSMKLSRQSQLEPSFGSIQMYLQHTQERLVVDIIQARNLSVSHILKSSRSSAKFSTYIKITFYCAGQKVKTKKSSIVSSDRNPRYEYSCDFKTVENCLDDSYIVLSVILKVNLRKDITLGRYILGPHFFSENRELTPWGRVVLNNEEIHHWFHLYL